MDCLLPFILMDRDLGIVSTATIDYAMLREPGGCPLRGVAELIQFFVDDYSDKENISERVWNRIWSGLTENGISLSLVGRRGADEMSEEGRAEDDRTRDDDSVLDEIIEGVT